MFFAFGVVLFTIIQVIPGRKAGLESFFFGSTASMLYSDALLILMLSILTALVLFLFLRPIKPYFEATAKHWHFCAAR